MKNTSRWVPQSIRQKISKQSKGKCFHCGKKARRADISPRGYLRFFDENDNTYHLDHIVPRSQGGTNDESNLVISCATCNLGIRTKKAENDKMVIKILNDINK